MKKTKILINERTQSSQTNQTTGRETELLNCSSMFHTGNVHHFPSSFFIVYFYKVLFQFFSLRTSPQENTSQKKASLIKATTADFLPWTRRPCRGRDSASSESPHFFFFFYLALIGRVRGILMRLNGLPSLSAPLPFSLNPPNPTNLAFEVGPQRSASKPHLQRDNMLPPMWGKYQ